MAKQTQTTPKPFIMSVSEQGIRLLHHFEGCKLKAYKCPAGVWTIGFGNTFYEDGSKVKEGDIITQERADSLFLNILKKFELTVLEKVKRPLKCFEFDALVSFCYNCGTSYRTAAGQWRDYDIWRRAQQKEDGMQKYWSNLAITAGGKRKEGLARRRRSEVRLYLKGEVKFYD